MNISFQTSRRIEFRDTDCAGIAHFSVFFVFMEQAEHEFLRSLGLSVVTEIEDQIISWPRRHASCEYLRPIRFEALLTVELRIKRLGDRSVTYAFEFHSEGERVAAGELVVVCCQIAHAKPPAPITIPESIREKLAQYLI